MLHTYHSPVPSIGRAGASFSYDMHRGVQYKKLAAVGSHIWQTVYSLRMYI